MSPQASPHYPRLTPAEARVIVARTLGSLVHPAKPTTPAPLPVNLRRRNEKRLWRAANVAKGLTVDGKPRKLRPYHPNIRHGLTKDRSAYMRWWRSRKRQSNSKAPA